MKFRKSKGNVELIANEVTFWVSFVKQVPVLQNNSGPVLVGLGTIACHLAREAKRPDLLGDSAESRAVVQQWLEHRVTKLDRCRKDDAKAFLKVRVHVPQKTTLFRHVLHFSGFNPQVGEAKQDLSLHLCSVPTSKVLLASAHLDKEKHNKNTGWSLALQWHGISKQWKKM